MPVKASDQRPPARWARALYGARGRELADAFVPWPAPIAHEHSEDSRQRDGDENEPGDEEKEEVATSSPGQQLSNIQIPPPAPVPAPAARQQVESEAREISTINGPISVGPRKVHKRSKPPSKSPGDEPLIHTDQLSASSPILYVYAPPYAGAQMYPGRQVASSRGAELVAESSPRAAVLAAVYEPPREPLVARLSVVNLEVASDTATLTWTLGLYPAVEGEQMKPAAGTASLLAGARRGQESEPAVEGNAESKGGDNAFAANSSRPRLKAAERRAGGVPAAAPEHLNKAPIVKRDTMLALPTLNWRNSTTGNEINQDKDKRARPTSVHKWPPRSRLMLAPAAANGEPSDPQAANGHQDDEEPTREAREEHKEQGDLSGQPAAAPGPPVEEPPVVGPSVSASGAAAAASKPHRDNKLGQQQRGPKVAPSRSLDQLAGRFQLTRLQALAPSPTVNRRPPVRGQQQSLSAPPAVHLGASEEEPEKAAISTQPQRENSTDSRRPLRATASRTLAAASASGQLRGPTEPPMIRAPIVPLNRLPSTLAASSASTSTSTTTTTTTQRPRATSGARSGKNLGELGGRRPSSPTPPASGEQEDEPNSSGTSYHNATTKVLPAGHAHSAADSPAEVTPTSGPTKSTSTGQPSSPAATSGGDEVSPLSASEPTTKSVSRIEPPIQSNRSTAVERPATPPPAAPAASSTRRPEDTPTPRATSSRLPSSSSAPESLEVEGISMQTRDAEVVAHPPVVVPPPPRPPAPSQLPNESKWLIRLRRFASNEVDIVKIVVNNLSQSILKQMQLTARPMDEENGAKQQSQPLLRYVSFKNLEPASAYEICVESASPDQQVGDRFQILDANHFLKCHDSSQTELTNSSIAATTTTSGSSRGQAASEDAALQRHLVRRTEDQTSGSSQHLFSSSSGADWPSDERREQPLELAADVGEPSAVKRKRAAPPDGASGAEEPQVDAGKLKSLCKEFFTLPAHSNERISFGQGAWPVGQPQRQQRPTAFVSLGPGQGSNSSGAGPRRPKSLNSALKSRMELLEIHDLLAPGSPESRTFEMVASGGSHSAATSPGAGEQGRPLSSTAASEHSPSIHQLLPGGRPPVVAGTTPTSVGHGRSGPLEGVGGRSGEPTASVTSSNGNYMVGAHSMLPIVACIFGLIFIITLANLLLNSISCRPASRSRRLRARRHQLSGANLASGSPGANLGRSAAHLGSFYSDQSDQSGGGGSQTRIVVVGKHNGLAEPFANASAYFEVPVDRRSASLEPGAGAAGGGGSSGPGSSAGRHSSSYLLAASSATAAAASARFPLGPSFEGDERHNADMVGLARKNYDEFIHRIYNHSSGEQLAGEQIGAKERQEQCPTHRHKNPAPLGNARGHPAASRQHRRSTACVSSQHLLGAAEQFSANSGAASSPECGRQDSSGQARKQRIRFDKINPIYNMEGLYLTGSPSVAASVSSGGGGGQRSKRSSGVSTFGRLNAAGSTANSAPLIAEEEAPRSPDSSVSSASSASERRPGGQATRAVRGAGAQEGEDQCPLCSPRAQRSSCCDSSPAGGQANGQECSGACQAYSIGAETVNGSSLEPESGEAYFTCCLDKQKQRFHAQQQQLERVLTKTGSLLPQPFINPSGPARCSSPACQSVVRDHEQVSAAAAAFVEGTKGEQSLGSEQALLLDADDSLGQLDKGDQEMIDMKAVVSSCAAPSAGAKSNQQIWNSAERQGDFYAFRPQTPPPPPPIESPEPAPGEELGDGEGEAQVSSSSSASVSSDSEKKNPQASVSASYGRERKKKCAEPSARQSTNSNTSPAKVSLKLSSMGSCELGDDKRKSETINKTDFNQRRNELASKLHLAGMIKPS